MNKDVMRRATRRPARCRRGWDSGQASVELVIMIGPVFLTLIAIIGVVFYNAFAAIALTTVANDCAQTASQNMLTTWAAHQGTEAFEAGRSGYGVGAATLVESPVRPELGANTLHSVAVYCIVDVPGREIVEGVNESTIYRKIAWPLQVYRSCYDPAQPGVQVGEVEDPSGGESARECGPH